MSSHSHEVLKFKVLRAVNLVDGPQPLQISKPPLNHPENASGFARMVDSEDIRKMAREDSKILKAALEKNAFSV
ncbi:MAG: hypothetical protein HY360_06815 [Verrucomicrobia bacterium]|nr:hypothetical protein [Verrucomicrobiota bacterium]